MTQPLLGIDYARTLDLQAAWDAGYRYLVRYVAPPDAKYDWKRLTPAERDEAWRIGFNVLLVFESWAGRALDGFQAGVDDARIGVAAAQALGYPADVPIFFADDTNTTADQVRPYFKGVATVRPCSGIYGGINAVDPLLVDGTARFGWQACAWSGQQVSQVAHLYQRRRPTLGFTGFFDEDVLLKPLPMWTPPTKTQPAPAPAPATKTSTGRRTPVPYMFRVTDGPAANTEIFDYGDGPVHIDGPEAQELADAKIPIVPISGRTYDRRFKDVIK